MTGDDYGWWACGVLIAVNLFAFCYLLDQVPPDWAVLAGFAYFPALLLWGPKMLERL